MPRKVRNFLLSEDTMKRGTRVKRTDNGQVGVVYKVKGGILSVIVVGGKRAQGKEPMPLGHITTWHESMVTKCVCLFTASDIINAQAKGN